MLAAAATSIHPDAPLEGLTVGDFPEPEVPEGWVRVHVDAASLNHHDLWSLRGVGLSAERLPMILGCDAAGHLDSGEKVIIHGVIGDPDVGGLPRRRRDEGDRRGARLSFGQGLERGRGHRRDGDRHHLEACGSELGAEAGLEDARGGLAARHDDDPRGLRGVRLRRRDAHRDRRQQPEHPRPAERAIHQRESTARATAA